MTAVTEINNYHKLQKALGLVNQRKLDKDRFSSWLFRAYLTKEISRREYYSLFSELEKNLHHFCTDRELANVLKRMDWRTLGEFALMIYDNTLREKILTEAWIDLCQKNGLLRQATLADYGMSNDGMIKFALHEVNHKPDFKITVIDGTIEIPDGCHKLEVKYCPSSRFLTYKEKDIKSYIKENSYVLTILGENKMCGANGKPDADDQFDTENLGLSYWAVLTPESLQRLLREHPAQIHRGYMGNKPCIRLYRDDRPNFAEYFTLHEWK